MAAAPNEKPLPSMLSMLQRIAKQIEVFEDSSDSLKAVLSKILSKLEQIEQNQQIMIDMSSKLNEDSDTFVNIDDIISSPTFANALKNIIKTKNQLKYAPAIRTIYEAGFEEEDTEGNGNSH